ncbi:SAF domain-containing protein [Nocardioides sp. NPDC058538]|uniref:SAF domain-containing protein n=1 Tax=Nocardioides sp. NPDC058538 TaxID=3346542 RepID=UPI0036660A5E
MTKQATDDNRFTGRNESTAPRLVPPVKIRRRPGHIVATIAATLVGAAIASWAWLGTTSSEEVVVARTTIHQGDLIAADDLATTRISRDSAVRVVPSASLHGLIGKRAALDIATGGLLTPASTTQEDWPPSGRSLVGVPMTFGKAPGIEFENGDLVRIVSTPAEGEEPASGAPLTTDAEVVGTQVDEVSGETVVNVLVPYADASTLAARAASGDVALVVDPREH